MHARGEPGSRDLNLSSRSRWYQYIEFLSADTLFLWSFSKTKLRLTLLKSVWNKARSCHQCSRNIYNRPWINIDAISRLWLLNAYYATCLTILRCWNCGAKVELTPVQPQRDRTNWNWTTSRWVSAKNWMRAVQWLEVVISVLRFFNRQIYLFNFIATTDIRIKRSPVEEHPPSTRLH